ncbi:hypothetical protein [Fontibacillus sp. BL9]|uniref:hypothetical protein n=1 Tax=Fontibacillus sp. BL9 TaxID=3389971 RepID=UPI00397AA1B6
MDHIELWVLFFLIIIGLGWLNQKHRYSGRVKTAYRDLRELADRTRQDLSHARDLEIWEARLRELEEHPNEFNKLDQEISLRETFVLYLEKHYPGDPRLKQLKDAAAVQKDTVWGVKVRR